MNTTTIVIIVLSSIIFLGLLIFFLPIRKIIDGVLDFIEYIFNYLFGGLGGSVSILNMILIIFVICVILLAIVLGFWYGYNPSSDTPNKTYNAKTVRVLPKTISPTTIVPYNFTYSIWMKIENLTYRFGQPKIIFANSNDVIYDNYYPKTVDEIAQPIVLLDPTKSEIQVICKCFKGSTIDYTIADNAIMNTCVVKNIPTTLWTNVIVSVTDKILDVYIDGVLKQTCVLPGVVYTSEPSNIYITPNGGFAGETAGFQYLNYGANQSKVNEIFSQGK